MNYLIVLLIIIVFCLFMFIYGKHFISKQSYEQIEGSSIFDQASNNNYCLLAYLPWNEHWTFLRYNGSTENPTWNFIISSLDSYFFSKEGIMKTGTLTNTSSIKATCPQVGFCHSIFRNENNFNYNIYGQEKKSHENTELSQEPLKGKNPDYLRTFYAYTNDANICLGQINSGIWNIDGLFIQSLEGLIHDEDIAVGLNEKKLVSVYGSSGKDAKKDVTKQSFYTDSGETFWGKIFDEYEFHVMESAVNIPDAEFYDEDYMDDLRNLAIVLSFPIIDAWIVDMTSGNHLNINAESSWKTIISSVTYTYTMQAGLFTDNDASPAPLPTNGTQGTITYVDILKNLKKDNLDKWTQALDLPDINTYKLDLVEISTEPSKGSNPQAQVFYNKIISNKLSPAEEKEAQTYNESIKKLPNDVPPE